MSPELIFSISASILALLYGAFLVRWVVRQPAGDEAMQRIAHAIQEGAQAYLNRQYKTIVVVAAIVAILIGIFLNITTALAFLVGACFSGAAGYIGMNVSVRANVRTAEAAKRGMAPALDMAVKGGLVTGLLVVGLGLLGVAGF